jgi:hypothetical protein
VPVQSRRPAARRHAHLDREQRRAARQERELVGSNMDSLAVDHVD